MNLHFFPVVSSACIRTQDTIVTFFWVDISVAIFTAALLEEQRDDSQGTEVFVIISLFSQIFLWIWNSWSEVQKAPLAHRESKGITCSVSESFSRYFKIRIFSVHGKINGGDVFPFRNFEWGLAISTVLTLELSRFHTEGNLKRKVCLFSQCLFFF